MGGLEQLVSRVKFSNVITHGPTTETGKGAADAPTFRTAMAASGAKELVVKPGDIIPLKGVDVKVLASNRQLIAAPRSAARPIRCARASGQRRADTSDNSASVGMLFTFGKFRFLDLGDLTQDLEFEMACPVNRIGQVDLFLTTHHGSGQSNAPVLVHALKSRVAIMNNGARKGGDLPVLQTVQRRSRSRGPVDAALPVAAASRRQRGRAVDRERRRVSDPAVNDTGLRHQRVGCSRMGHSRL